MIKGIMFKIEGGLKRYNFEIVAISDNHAISVADDLYKSLGLIGRFYIEMETGYNFQITNS